MNKDALKLAAAKLRGLDKKLADTGQLKKFDMGTWFRRDKCGTAGCFIGWAATLQWFEPLGLSIELKEVKVSPGSTYTVPAYYRGGRPVTITEFFGFEDQETAELLIAPEKFPDDGSIRPVDVAERIEMLLQKGELAFLEYFEDEDDEDDEDD